MKPQAQLASDRGVMFSVAQNCIPQHVGNCQGAGPLPSACRLEIGDTAQRGEGETEAGQRFQPAWAKGKNFTRLATIPSDTDRLQIGATGSAPAKVKL